MTFSPEEIAEQGEQLKNEMKNEVKDALQILKDMKDGKGVRADVYARVAVERLVDDLSILEDESVEIVGDLDPKTHGLTREELPLLVQKHFEEAVDAS